MIGVIGIGVVGAAVLKAFSRVSETVGYDITGSYADEAYFEDIINKCAVVFVCVPTPTIDGKQDLLALENVIQRLVLNKYYGIVCIKCTTLPGTCERLQKESKLRIVHNPEFLTAAKPYADFISQRAVLLSGKVGDTWTIRDLYRKLLPCVNCHTYSDYKITELAKYYSNCFLAVKVTFANEMYDLCSALECSYDSVAEAAISQGLIGENHTKVPGPDGGFGYSGVCLPKEQAAMSTFFKENGLICPVIDAAIKANDMRRTFDNQCREVGKPIVIL